MGLTIDVSGNDGGGAINIGGDAHGAGTLAHANAVVMMPTVSLLADALENGNGGNVVLWSDNFTNVIGGTISALGVSAWEEMAVGSKHRVMIILNVGDASVNLTAPMGTAGTWLLDPDSITIGATGTPLAKWLLYLYF